MEVGSALTQRTQFSEIARVQGEGTYLGDDGVRYSVAVQTEAIPNVGDAWGALGAALDRLWRDGASTVGSPSAAASCCDLCSPDEFSVSEQLSGVFTWLWRPSIFRASEGSCHP